MHVLATGAQATSAAMLSWHSGNRAMMSLCSTIYRRETGGWFQPIPRLSKAMWVIAS
jgi:hypothetical protein